MKIIKKLSLVSVSLLALGCLFTGCEKEKEDVAKAVLASASTLSFTGQDAAEQIITVYSDATWTADVPDWVTISPATGSGTTDVTVSVSDNMRDGALDNPRKAEVVFHGNTIASRATVIIRQDGDKFRDVAEITVSEVEGLADEDIAVIKTSQVTAVTSRGVIISDGKSAVYVITDETAAIGDQVEVWGTKGSESHLAIISDIEKFVVTPGGTAVYPEAVDITSQIDSYTSTSRTYIDVTGMLKGNTITVTGAETMRVNLQDVPESIDIDALNNHNVTVHGYFAGVAAPYVNVIIATVDDLGVAAGTGKLPVKWILGTDDINFKETFPATGKVMPVENEGYIEYVPYDLENTNNNNKYKLDVSANNPRVTGPWPGDYWYFCTNASAKAGDAVQISFETRTSGTGHKFWRLEYMDGTEWKIAGEKLVTNEPGYEVVYTHAMNADGSTNVFVNTTVTYSNDTPVHEFRFVCAANWQANGKGALATRNGGSARLSITDSADSEHQPTIQKGESASPVVFEDDFSWMREYIDIYNAANPSNPIGKSVEDNNASGNAPNVYTETTLVASGLLQALNDKGYVDLNAEKTSLYPQDCYWKFGKTSVHTGFRLPPMDYNGDVVISFDWSPHMTGSGKIDKVNVVVEVEGEGKVVTAAGEASVSDPFANDWSAGQLGWKNVSATIKGLKSTDRIVIRPEYMENHDGITQMRWYLDNIYVEKVK